MSDRKTIYHGELRSPTKVTVKSDALKSKYKQDPGEPGYKYVFLDINGVERSYFAENQKCANTMASHKGQTVTVLAHGSGEDAYIEIDPVEGANKPEPTKPTTTTAEEKARIIVPEQFTPVSKAKAVLNRVANAFWLVEQHLQKEMEQAKISGVDEKYLTAENFGGKAGTAFRELKEADLINQMPDQPMWSAEYQANEQRS
jgi:hypothetical protein